jgi:anti-sigma factor RsiW
MTTRRNKELQRYFDDEIGRRHAERVRRQLERSPEDRARLSNLGTMRSLIRDASASAVEGASFDRLWAGVSAGIAAQRPLGVGERFRLWLRSYGLVTASAAAAIVLALFLLLPLNGEPRNDCEIESLDADPSTVSTIFTIYSPEKDDKTTVIWVSDEPPPEGGVD